MGRVDLGGVCVCVGGEPIIRNLVWGEKKSNFRKKKKKLRQIVNFDLSTTEIKYITNY